MSWIEVRASFAQAPEDWSPLVDLFGRHGCENTLQVDSPPSIAGCVVDVPGAQEQVDALRSELSASGASAVHVGPYEELDWEESWKQFFKTRRVGKSFVIRPTWEEFEPQSGDHVITLDPGQAFGTGDHPTTRMCLELLEDASVSGARVLDVGCGSGILAIGARLLGAAEVVAVDVDPLAVEVARQNAAVNGVEIEAAVCDGFPGSATGDGRQATGNRRRTPEAAEDRRQAPAGVPRATGQQVSYDVVLSNIISAALIRFAGDAAHALKPAGRWIVSGILTTNWPDVKKAAERAGFKLEKQMEEDDWVAATFLR
ncbi:MAG: ribosomal protein methyltransferase [Fimbriimonadaceae bacterium]|nr:ribosomal protein methyltransferase [Fimbriimonadaceae bacterium]